MEETTSWFCDTCDGLIRDAESGMLQIVCPRPRPGRPKGRCVARIVHAHWASPRAGGCYLPDRDPADEPVTTLLGWRGLAYLRREVAGMGVPEDELMEIILRVHVPGYEHHRRLSRPAARRASS